MKRAGVYFFYDERGVVDGYVPYFIQELHRVVDYIVVVVNGKLTVEGRKTLSSVADDLFVRENKGFDAWAYKEAIEEYIGWDQLCTFDELVLTNFTLYGPIYPFQEIFAQMEADPCDFWGMFRLYEDKHMKSFFDVPLKWGYRPEYVCSNFLVFKGSVLHGFEFRHFWDNLPPIRSYFETVVYFEMSISRELSDAGFIYATADEGQFRHVYPSSTIYGAYDMITKYRVPLIRKKAFFDQNGSLDYCTDVPRKTMRYIAENTGYDCDLIWENILRTVNLYDLKNWFNWNYILPLDYSREPADAKIAVIFHTYYDDIMERYFHNIEAFPDGTDFYFTTDTEVKIEALKSLLSPLDSRFHIEYRIVENRGRDVSALLVGCRDVVLEGGYDLICFMHGKKGIGNSEPFSCVGQAYSDCCFENTAANTDYVNNVIDLFKRESRLGLAIPPTPKNGRYYQSIGDGWQNNYQSTVRFIKQMGLGTPLDERKPPVFPYGSVFWFRPEALGPLFARTWRYEDFCEEPMRGNGTISHAIERSHGFIAQSQGYYTAVIMNSIYAEQEITRMTEIAHAYVDLTMRYVGTRLTLKQAATLLQQKLQQSGITAPKAQPLGTLSPQQVKPRSPAKSFIRGICPIGLWNLLRRVRCAAAGGQYVEPYVERGAFKTVVRACTPRFLWNELRKAKCRKNGWGYVED